MPARSAHEELEQVQRQRKVQRQRNTAHADALYLFASIDKALGAPGSRYEIATLIMRAYEKGHSDGWSEGYESG